MNNGQRSHHPWNTKRLALTGAILGVAVGIVHAYVHAFWSERAIDVITHVQIRMIIFPAIGAALLAAVSATINLFRRRQDWFRARSASNPNQGER